MSAGTRLHRRAYRLAKRVGEAITFTEITQAYDPATGLVTPTEVSIPGRVVRDEPNYERYQELGLTSTNAQSLVFTPTTFGRVPKLGSSCTYNSETYTLKEAEPFGPAGEPSVIRVIIVK